MLALATAQLVHVFRLGAQQLTLRLLPKTHACLNPRTRTHLRHVSGQGAQQRDAVLCSRHRVGRGGVDHQAAVLGEG